MLRELLEEIETNSPAVNLKRKGVVFTEPFLVADVEYRAWTEDGKLRHPSFKGIRERADDATVFELAEYCFRSLWSENQFCRNGSLRQLIHHR
ncbi:ATP-dependent DNA ligase [Sinorhizobium kostiense]|uniref:DNA ligase (ATP) n=1 Tax=Sinorhizobium kostiense TaxID=76747 RepID=A0ABS4R5W7_9HYPH|nr:ATP-dependent DNA ligase [Sinorhizobium kostiense]